MNKIVSIELTSIHVPFKKEVQQMMESGEGGLGMAIPSEEPWLGGDFAICRLTSSDGCVGVSDVYCWAPEDGTFPDHIILTIKKGLKKYVLGESPFNVEHMLRRMDNNITRNEMAKGLLDAACYDLMGKITNQRACDLMGGGNIDKIPLAVLIPLMNVKDMARYAKTFYGAGFRTFRYKLGRNIQEDVEISQALREELGSEVRLRVDYNQAYKPAAAVRAIKAIESFGIDYAEQPVDTEDYLGMAYVQKRVNTPLMVHEGFNSLKDFLTLVELKAVGILGVNHARPGGVTRALKAIDYAKLRGLGIVIHDQSLGISAAMLIHLATARYPSIDHATELWGHMMLEDDLIVKPIKFDKGMASVPEGPGWGIELDEKALEKYATAPTVVLKQD